MSTSLSQTCEEKNIQILCNGTALFCLNVSMTNDKSFSRTAFIRQNLTFVDVRFWTLGSDGPHIERMKIFLTAVAHNISMQMKREKLTKTFMLISN